MLLFHLGGPFIVWGCLAHWLLRHFLARWRRKHVHIALWRTDQAALQIFMSALESLLRDFMVELLEIRGKFGTFVTMLLNEIYEHIEVTNQDSALQNVTPDSSWWCTAYLWPLIYILPSPRRKTLLRADWWLHSAKLFWGNRWSLRYYRWLCHLTLLLREHLRDVYVVRARLRVIGNMKP